MLKDFGQKNRTRPILITNVAIEKVRVVALEGVSTEENRFIQEQHKRLLQISKTCNNSEEVGI